MEYKEKKKRLAEARALLLGSALTQDSYKKLRDILYGVHLNLDDTLHILDVRATELGRMMGAAFLSVPFDQMPETTEEEKRRKQLVAEFGEGIGKLKTEIDGVESDLDNAQVEEKKKRKKWHFRNPFAFLRGPIVFIFGSLAFLVGLLYFTSSPLYILNNGCPPIPPIAKVPDWVPGVLFPKDTIETGGRGYANIPGFTYRIDGTLSGTLYVRLYLLSFPIDITHIDDVQIDGFTILGRTKTIPAFLSGDHYLEVICNAPQPSASTVSI